MAETLYGSDVKEKDTDEERSKKDLRREISRREEDISQTIHKIGDQIKHKVDWHRYVNESPYVALGASFGLGFLASRLLARRQTPMEDFMDTVADRGRYFLDDIRARQTRPSLLQLLVVGIGTRMVMKKIRENKLKNREIPQHPPGT